MSELIYGYPQEIHEHAERVIAREVLANQSFLVSALCRSEIDDGDGKPQPFFELAEFHNEYEAPPENLGDLLKWWRDVTVESPPTRDEIYADDEYLAELLGLAETLERDPQEVYEWWLVTEWFGRKLISHGEPVLEALGCTWWGRTCTGQQILLDGTVQEIVKGLT